MSTAETLVEPRHAPALDRLARATHVTLQRNVDRAPTDYSLFDGARIDNAEAVRFVVTQIAYIETESPKNLAALTRVVPLPSLQAAFSAQIQDEVAHGLMFNGWLARAGGVDIHPAARFSTWAAERMQSDAWLGGLNATLMIELYASALHDELLPRLTEPCLREILLQVMKDEARHKVIAVEALTKMREIGWDKRALVRALGPLVNKGTVAYFRWVFGTVMDKQAAALELPTAAILERALDEADAALTRALA